MTLLIGTVIRSARGGTQIPQLCDALHGLTLDAWPPHAAVARATAHGTRHAIVPIAAYGRVRAGQLIRSYLRDFYYRVHIDPAVIALGNLVTAQTRTVRVWNAYPDRPLTLQAVEAINADGITVTGPAALPLAFAPLQEQLWQLALSASGAAVVDATLRWHFASSDDDVTLRLSGNRITAWMIPPDWSNGITETLTWLTDVERAIDGTVQRQPCREAPRRQWEFSVIAEGSDRRVLELALFDASARVWAVPVWPDVTFLTADLGAGSDTIALATDGLDFVLGGLAMLWASATRFELIEVAAVASNAITLAHPTANTWVAGSRLYPCRTATLTDFPALARASDRLVQSQIRFLAAEPCDWPALAPVTMYLGFPVLDMPRDEPANRDASYGRVITTLDNDSGLPVIDDASGLSFVALPFDVLQVGRAERAAHRSLLYWLAGQAQALWLASGMDDVVVLGPISTHVTTLSVAWSGITRFGALQPGRRHLRIALWDGSVFYRRITAVAEIDAASEQFVIDTPLGRDVALEDLRLVSWLTLVTLAADAIEIQHLTDSEGVATGSLRFAGVPQEEP